MAMDQQTWQMSPTPPFHCRTTRQRLVGLTGCTSATLHWHLLYNHVVPRPAEPPIPLHHARLRNERNHRSHGHWEFLSSQAARHYILTPGKVLLRIPQSDDLAFQSGNARVSPPPSHGTRLVRYIAHSHQRSALYSTRPAYPHRRRVDSGTTLGDH